MASGGGFFLPARDRLLTAHGGHVMHKRNLVESPDFCGRISCDFGDVKPRRMYAHIDVHIRLQLCERQGRDVHED